MEHQAKLNEKYMAVANVTVLVTGNTNIKVPAYLKLHLRRRNSGYSYIYLNISGCPIDSFPICKIEKKY